MKYSFLTLLFFLAISCKPQTEKTSSPTKSDAVAATENMDWLLGSWERTGEKEGKQTYEYWTKNESSNYIGMGCTLKNQDTIWKENILLAKDDKGWKFEVTGLGDSVSTIFRLTQLDKDQFTCENKANEFPKKIEYAYDGANINAVISGGGPTIPFNFVKMKQ